MRFFFERIFDLSFDLKKKKDTVYIKNLCIRSKRFSYYAIFASLRDIQYIYFHILSQGTNDWLVACNDLHAKALQTISVKFRMTYQQRR